MKYLTFLDYPTVESVGKDFESQIKEKDKEIEELRSQMGNLFTQAEDRRKEHEDMIQRLEKMEIKKSEWDTAKKLMVEKVKEMQKVSLPEIPTFEQLIEDIRNKNKKKQ